MAISNKPNNVPSEGVGIGRITDTQVIDAVGTLSPAIDLQIFAGAALETPLGHTGTISIFSSGDENGVYYQHYDSDGNALQIINAVGQSHYTFPANVFPAHWLKLSGVVDGLQYIVRKKG